MKVIDYLEKRNKRLISPIWGGKKEFSFLCLGHLEFSKALGFNLLKISDYLSIVEENKIITEEDVDYLIKKKEFDYSYFEHELSVLADLKSETKEGWYGGGCFGPLTVVSGILGAERMLKYLRKKTDLVKKFVSYVTDYMIELAKREDEFGQDFFWIAEPVASLLSPENFWLFSGQYLQKIYQSINAPGFLHVCGKTLPHTANMVRTGAQVLSIDSCTDLLASLQLVEKDVVIMGNISPSLLQLGSKEEVEEEVKKMLNSSKNYKNYIVSTGCSVMENTPDSNMKILFDLLEDA